MSMLSPKRTKFRKMQKGRTRGTAKGGNEISFGDFGLQVDSPGWLTARQIEAARVAISRSVKKFGKIGRDICWQVHLLRQNISCSKPSGNVWGAKSRVKVVSRGCEIGPKPLLRERHLPAAVSDHQHPYFFERTPGGILVR